MQEDFGGLVDSVKISLLSQSEEGRRIGGKRKEKRSKLGMVKSLFYIRHRGLQGNTTHPSHGDCLETTPTFRKGSASIRVCGLTLNRQHNYGV